MDCREEFEKECESLADYYPINLRKNINFEEHGYIDHDTDVFYMVWKACWNLLQESKPIGVEWLRDKLWKQDIVHIKLSEAIGLAQSIHAALPSQPDIDQLKAENKAMREALENISNDNNDLDEAWIIARNVLDNYSGVNND